MVDHVEKTGDTMLQTLNPGPERDILKFKLADMSRRFNNAKDKSTDRKEMLDQLAPLMERYQNASQPFNTFLEDSEEKIGGLKAIPQDEETAAKQRSDIKVSSAGCLFVKHRVAALSRLEQCKYTREIF